MNIRTKRITIWLTVMLLILWTAQASAFDDTVADRPLWSSCGEVEIRFRTINNHYGENDYEDGIRRSLIWEPWDGHLEYGDYEAQKPATPDQAEIIRIDARKKEYTVLFHQPGRYFIDGVRVYILDPENETLATVASGLTRAAEECRGRNEKETASLVRNWIVRNIQYGEEFADYPEREQYEDPIGVLIGGKAICTGYANLYMLMAETCGIRTTVLTVETRKTGGGHQINLNRLDGEWSFTDVTWDDGGKKSRNQYFAMDEKRMNKYYMIPDYNEFYSRWFSSPEQIMKLNSILDF